MAKSQNAPEKGDTFLVGLQIVDYERIKFVDVKLDPTGPTIVGGKNAQGKSSLINGVESLLFQPPKEIKEPIRRGAAAARIVGQFDGARKFRIERSWKRDRDGKVATELKVYDEMGSSMGPGKQFLDNFVSEVFFRPSDFYRKTPIERRQLVCSLAEPAIDWDAYRAQLAEAREAEKDKQKEFDFVRAQGIQAKEELAALGFSEDEVPDELVDAAEMQKALQQANQTISANAKVRADHQNHQRIISDNDARIASLKEEVKKLESNNSERQQWMKANPAPGEDADPSTEEFVVAIQSAEATNQAVRAKATLVQRRQAAERAKAIADDAAKAAKKIEEDFRTMLSQARFPIEGLSANENDATYNGVEIRQASQAEVIHIGTAILLTNPARIKPVLIEDASLLDSAWLQKTIELALSKGAQPILEVVADPVIPGSEDRCNLVLEDGCVKGDKEAEALL